MTSSIQQSEKSLLGRLGAYWDSDSENSFPALSHRLTEISQLVGQAREKAVQEASLLLQKKGSTEGFLSQQIVLLKSYCQQTKKVMLVFEEASQLSVDLVLLKRNLAQAPLVLTDIEQFEKRLQGLSAEICQLKKESLFSFYQTIINVQNGWDPSGNIRWFLDLFWKRQIGDPSKELEPFFKENLP